MITCIDCGGEFHEEVVKEKAKKEFIREYVLNRSRAIPGSFTGIGAAEEASQIWERFLK